MKQGGSQKAVFRPKLLAVSVAACFAVSATQLSAQVLPTGATGVTGVTGISQAGSTLTVNTSGNSVLNYTSFSIGAGATVQINQASAAFASLQRVIGAGGVIPQSVIDGMLKSNGRVFLLNPSGVVIGAGARIDVAGFVASSLNMSDDDFLNGRLRFTENAAAKAVKNYGEITTASGGHVYLVAPEVENHGIIRAPQGQILLAAGKSAELISDASPYVTVKVVADAEKALNVGKLIADSGKIGIYGALVQHSGVAEASGAVVGPGGQIRFIATKDLTIDAGSRIAANGTSGGQIVLQAAGGTNLIGGTVEAKGSSGKGGEVQALGVRVGVVGHGIIDASGEAGGGTVLVGGDFQGKNPEIQNAERTFIGPDGVIRADAGANGDGGRVIVWADGDTRFYGHISAQGGSQSGDGGFVETSAKGHLVAMGTVNAGAPHGKAGTWLLDPDDIVIVSGSGGDDGELIGDGTLAFGDMPSGYGFSTVGTYGIYNAMTGPYGTNVVLQANNTISLETDINSAPYAGKSLTLHAGSQINLASYGITTDGDLTLTAPTITSEGTNYVSLVSLSGFTTLNGTADLGTGIEISGKTGVSTGNIFTNNYDSHVTISSGYGSVSTGMIKTLDGNDGGSVISISTASGYGGTITTGDLSSNGHGTGINLSADGTVSTGNLSARPLESGIDSGNVIVISHNGRVVVNGSVDTRGRDGDELDPYGRAGGVVQLIAQNSTDPAAVTVTGLIRTSGGNGGDSYGTIGWGGAAGSVFAYGFAGGVSIGGIQALGGAGGTTIVCCSAGGDGGAGGSVNIGASGGPIAVGSIETRGGAGGGSFSDDAGNGGNGGSVLITSAPTSVAVNFIDTSGGAGGHSFGYFGGNGGAGGSVTATSGGSPKVIGSINASGGAGGAGRSDIEGGNGGNGAAIDVRGTTVTVGTAASRGGAGGDGGEGGSGGNGSTVYLGGDNYVVAGVIDVSGGNAGLSESGDSIPGSGGSAGTASAYGYGGGVSINAIFALGGAGSSASSASGSSGGNGGSVNLGAVGGPIAVGSIETRGGVGGGSVDGNGGFGGNGGSVFVANTPTSVSMTSIDSRGGAGGASQNANGGGGGDGNSIDVYTGSGSKSIGSADASGGAGGFGGGLGGYGGGGARIEIEGSTVNVTSAVTRGGAGGDGAQGGGGGGGGQVYLAGTSSVVAGTIDLSGGNAGSSSGGPGGTGGWGGFFDIWSSTGSVTVTSIAARGGAGSSGTSASRGGDGGEGQITAITSITLGLTPGVNQVNTVVDVSGGAGGNSSGVGGNGGHGGFVQIDPISITINGLLASRGGAGGTGATAGVGGNGGAFYLATTDGTGIITFVNGGWDVTAGAGGSDGAVFGAGMFPEVLAVAKFIYTGPGDLADIPVADVGTFRFTSISDPLANQAILQQVGLTQSENPDSGKGESTDEEDAEKEKTGSLGSCRPS